MNENNPFKSRETLTFSFKKEAFSSFWNIAKKNSFIAYFTYMTLLVIFTTLLFIIKLTHFGFAMLAFIVVFSLFYLFAFLKAKKNHKKQLRTIENNLYNYTLYPDQLIVTVKNDKHVFKEYVIPRRKVKANFTEDFLYFYYKRFTFTIPMYTLKQDSKFLALNRKRSNASSVK